MAGKDTQNTARTKAFTCKNCGGTVDVRAPGQTLIATCLYCQSTIDITDENYEILNLANKKFKKRLLIPLGARGELRGITWEVIGYIQRRGTPGGYDWDEFLLFNPIHGFRWLACSDGHWTLYKESKDKPTGKHPKHSQVIDGERFKYFDGYRARVIQVIGEFYWNVKKGDIVQIQDLILPPKILSIETTASSLNWSVGDYISPREVRQAFDSKEHQVSLPATMGIAPNQPNGTKKYFSEVKVPWLLMVVLLFASLIVTASMNTSSPLVKQEFTVNQNEQVFAAQKIVLPEGNNQMLTIKVESNPSNAWLEVQGALYDSAAGKSFNFQAPMSYYFGYDDGEKWTEGDKDVEININNVPSGTYSLVMEAYKDPNAPNLTFLFEMERGRFFMSNFFLIFLLISVVPFILWARSAYFEMRRWNPDMSFES